MPDTGRADGVAAPGRVTDTITISEVFMKRLLALVFLGVVSGAAHAATTDRDHTFPLPREKEAKPITLRFVYEKSDAGREKLLSDFCSGWVKWIAPAPPGRRCDNGVDETATGKSPEIRYFFVETQSRGGVTVSIPKNVRKNILHYTIDGAAFVNWNTREDEVTLGAPLPGYRGKARTGDH